MAMLKKNAPTAHLRIQRVLLLASTCSYITASSSFIPTLSQRTTFISNKPKETATNSSPEFSLDELSLMTVVELKDQLRKLNLPLGGRKHDLFDRLHAHYSSQPSTLPVIVNHMLEESVNLNAPASADSTKQGEPRVNESKFRHMENLHEYPFVEQRPSAGVEAIGRDETSSYFKVSESSTDGRAKMSSEESDNNVLDETITNSLTTDDKSKSSSEYPINRRASRKNNFKIEKFREDIRNNDHKAAKMRLELIAALESMAKENNKDALGLLNPKEIVDLIMKSNIPPTTTMLNAMMGAYASLGTVDAAERASSILERMEYLRDFGDGTVKPTVYSYSLVIHAWAKCRSFDAASNAENILHRLIKSYEHVLSDESKHDYADDLRPNSIVFNSVIDAWASSGSVTAGEKSEVLLAKMESYSRMNTYDVRPDTITFNTCIKAWCNGNHPDAPHKAEDILLRLESHPQYPKRNDGVSIVRPNLISYNTVINSWAKSTNPESALHAQSILMRMLKSYRMESFSTARPDVVTFSSVLNALAKSKVHYKAEKCLSILEAMIKLQDDDRCYDTTPNIICFNTVLNACAFSASGSDEEKKSAITVALRTFKMLDLRQKNTQPDAVSFGNMLKCCANLLPIGEIRTSLASKIFSSCCKEGLVGGMVLDEIRRSIPSSEFLNLLAKEGYRTPLKQHSNAISVQLHHLPHDWTANVQVGDMMQRQRDNYLRQSSTSQKRGSSRTKPEVPAVRKPGVLVETSWISGKDV